jgi:hypothetical protein
MGKRKKMTYGAHTSVIGRVQDRGAFLVIGKYNSLQIGPTASEAYFFKNQKIIIAHLRISE